MNNLGKNKKLLLAKYPNGLAELDDFISEEVEVPNIVDNELLIQSHYVGVDAALRLIVRDSDEFLFNGFNYCLSQNTKILFSSNDFIKNLDIKLADLESRLNTVLPVEILNPTDEEKMNLINFLIRLYLFKNIFPF